jgi:type I restriction enzyme S subunit
MKLVPLEKIVDILDNQRIPINSTERNKRPGIVPYYGATGQVGTIDEAIFDETLILLGEDGVPFFDSTKHKAYEISGPSWVNNHAHVLRAKSELVIQRYLLHFLNGFNYAGYVNGATRLKLTQANMKRIPVPLPSLEKQVEIVEKLDRAFADIDLLEENFASLDSLINECDTSILGRVLNSNNGEIEGHRNLTLGEVTELIARGVSPTYLDSANTVVLNQRCIRNGRIDLDFARNHDETAKRVQEAKLLQSGDGLINSTGVGTLGRTALFDHPGVGKYTVDSHVTIVRPKSDILDSNYFGLVLRALENVFVSLSTGTSGQTELPREAIKNTWITFPENLDEQKDFFAYYNSLNLAAIEFRKILINRRVLAETLRASLLSSAFTEAEEVA